MMADMRCDAVVTKQYGDRGGMGRGTKARDRWSFSKFS
jgi:hypothetical protein